MCFLKGIRVTKLVRAASSFVRKFGSPRRIAHDIFRRITSAEELFVSLTARGGACMDNSTVQ